MLPFRAIHARGSTQPASFRVFMRPVETITLLVLLKAVGVEAAQGVLAQAAATKPVRLVA